MNDHSIGKTIAQLRKAKGLTQAELANQLNVSDKAISKWENEAGLPEMSQFPALANLFNVSIDYLMTGKEGEEIVLDDMDSTKRMYYLIIKDDVDNYIKYDYITKTYFDDFNNTISPIQSIIENKSFKIFNACVKNGIATKHSRENDYTLVGALYQHIDELIKFACEADSLEFLEAIDFLSFAVGDKTLQLKNTNNVKIVHTSFRHTYDPKTAYLVSPKVFEFIFASSAVSNRIVEYVSTYKAFENEHINNFGKKENGFYYIEQNVIEQLYKSKRFVLLTNYLKQINADAGKTIFEYAISNKDDYDHVLYKVVNGYLLKCDVSNNGTTSILGKLITIGKRIIELTIANADKHWANIFVKYNQNIDNACVETFLLYKGNKVFIPNAQELELSIEESKRQRQINTIKEDTALTDKQRREAIFNVLSVDDYDMFVEFNEEDINKITLLDIIDADCCDVRFYNRAINVDGSVENLNNALKFVLEKHPERYDILNVLLSAGAVLDDNLAITNILKQNVDLHYDLILQRDAIFEKKMLRDVHSNFGWFDYCD